MVVGLLSDGYLCPFSLRKIDYGHQVMVEQVPQAMRAIKMHTTSGEIKLEEKVPVPSFAENQVLIRVMTIGVNRSEFHSDVGGHCELSSVPGTDCAGVVVRVGSKVTKVKAGERVYTVQSVSGTYAEFTIANEIHVFRLNDCVSFSQGAAFGVPYFTAYRSLFYIGQCRRGERVLVHGASGGVGLACCQIARAYGMHVIATAGSERGVELLRLNRFTSVFNHNKEDYLEEIQVAVQDQGVDIICEMLACKNLKNDIPLLARNGRIIVIGSQGQVTFSPAELVRGEKKIRSVDVFSSTEEEYSNIANAVEKGVEAGWLRPVIDQEFPLSEASAAHLEVVKHRRGTAGNLILST